MLALADLGLLTPLVVCLVDASIEPDMGSMLVQPTPVGGETNMPPYFGQFNQLIQLFQLFQGFQ